MPTYTYRCDTCQHQFDAAQRFADDPLRECPECGAAIRRVIQPVGVVFKGSGWYITDSRPKPAEDGKADEGKKKDNAQDGAKPAASGEKSEKSDKSGSGDSASPAKKESDKPAAAKAAAS